MTAWRLAMFLSLIGGAAAIGQERLAYKLSALNADDAEAAKKFQERARAAAVDYEIITNSSLGRKLTLRVDPILRWTNPVPERQMHGEVFLWTDDGRPAAVLCLFEMTESGFVRECHEFTSLASGPLIANRAENATWSPTEGQVDMKLLSGASVPADAPRQRLAQMREQAARFSCEKTTRMADARTLRMLSQPVARYKSPTHQVTDGALFAFVEATDPELFLLVEMREVRGSPQWHYGLARMVSVQLKVSLDSKTVWNVETLPYEEYRNRPDKPYTAIFMR
jgi:hypothetical protein